MKNREEMLNKYGSNEELKELIEHYYNLVEYDIHFRPDYRAGYFKALMDVYDLSKKWTPTLKSFRLNNVKGIRGIIKAMMANLDYQMSYGNMANYYLLQTADKKFTKWFKSEEELEKFKEDLEND